MKFRKKPVVIEAIQLVVDLVGWEPNIAEILDFIGSAYLSGKWVGAGFEVEIRTLEGVMTARLGDWIIRGVAGEVYPCKPEIFEQTYERVEEVEA